MSIEYTKLPNGLRVITDTVTSVDSVALGIWTDVGTRHEDLVHNGVAHMVEHMMFKGTPTRTAAQIAEQIEDVGGHVNAYTSREITSYHIHLLKNDAPMALEILSDIIQHPTMPEDEIERERHVILQEIGMATDTPDDLVYDLYQETAYPGQSLGAPILGRTEIVRAMSGETLMDYVHRFYTPGRLVISASGNIQHDDMVKQVSNLFGDLPQDMDFSPRSAHYQGGEIRTEKTLEQSHIILGFRGVSRLDERYYTAVALSTILGGGMSSRLFLEVREKRGLVYSIYSFHTTYQDDGQFIVYAGTGPDDLPELVPVVCEELMRTVFKSVSEAELKRAKAQMRANLLMGRESMMTRADQHAKHMIHFGDILNIDDKLKHIESVTAEDIQSLAKQIFSSQPTVSALGPLKTLEPYETLTERFAA